jgi:spermidine synthase
LPAILAGITSLLAFLVGSSLHQQLVHRRWETLAPGYDLVAESDSRFQNLAVGRLAEQFTLYCNGQVTVDFPDPYTFSPLAHFWMCQHPSPRRVLLLGGGAEGLLAEILLHPVERVDYVETDPQQIEIIEPYLANRDRLALADDRVTVHYQDARYYVKTQRNRFDLVIARLPEPTSALRARLYTREFFGELRRAMTPRSVLCLTVSATPGELTAFSGEYLASVAATLRAHFPNLIVGWGNPAHVLAATEDGLASTEPAALAERYSQRGIESDLFHPAWFQGATDWLDDEKLKRRQMELEEVQAVQVSTDLHPIVYLQRLVLWDRMTGGPHGRVIEQLRSINWQTLAAILVAASIVTLLVFRARSRRPVGWANGAVMVSIATTGFATMALSIIWLFAFQNLYGFVYQRIGWIIAVFMGGLVLGCALADRLSQSLTETAPLRRRLWQGLIVIDLLLVVLALSAPLVLPALGALQADRLSLALVEWAVLVLVAATGIAGGAAFAFGGGLDRVVVGRAGRAAGRIVTADHAGACVGALLTGVLLVPVYGTVTASFLLVGMKLASAALLIAAGHPKLEGSVDP